MTKYLALKQASQLNNGRKTNLDVSLVLVASLDKSKLIWPGMFSFTESQSQANITAAPPNPLRVVEGESVTLKWTYDLGGSPFDSIDFRVILPNPERIVRGRSSSDITIPNPEYQSRLTVNVSETNTTITFDAINRGDSKTYSFEVDNSAGLNDVKNVEIIVQCK